MKEFLISSGLGMNFFLIVAIAFAVAGVFMAKKKTNLGMQLGAICIFIAIVFLLFFLFAPPQ
ncbi:hypothetical protein GC174_10295 [bacterium]|nr:hypothetical protein [bacterium]